MASEVITGTIIEGSAVVLLARIIGGNGDPVVQANVTSGTYEVYKCGPPPGTLASGATPTPTRSSGGSPVPITVASAVYNTLQTDDRWTVDTTGYNFALTVPADKWPTTSIGEFYDKHFARCDVRLVMSDTSVLLVPFWPEEKPTLYGKGG